VSVQQMLGAAMLVLLFGGLFVFMAFDQGWRVAVGIYGTTLALVTWMAAACVLLGIPL
jgi:hypothetical protein